MTGGPKNKPPNDRWDQGYFHQNDPDAVCFVHQATAHRIAAEAIETVKNCPVLEVFRKDDGRWCYGPEGAHPCGPG